MGFGIGICISLHVFQMSVLYYIGAYQIKDQEEDWIFHSKIKTYQIFFVNTMGILVASTGSLIIPAIKCISEGRKAAQELIAVI